MVQNLNKILLIEPPFYRLFKDTYSLDLYPLAMGYLAATIQKETDWKVFAHNFDFTPQSEIQKYSYMSGKGFDNYLNNIRDISVPIWSEIKSYILEYNPDVIGISAKSQNFKSACNIAKLSKEINKQITVVVGGPHPSMVGPEVLKCPDIDICVKCEGEYTIVELLNSIARKEKFDNIHGIIYRKNGKITENPSREYISDLDSLPFPYKTAPDVLKDYDKYPDYAFNRIFATRGCPFNCFFCGSRKIWSRKVRFRSPDNVVAEINGLIKNRINSVHFNDDTFGTNKQYIKKLCNAIIEQIPGLKWSCEIHVKLINEEIISLMKKAGCFLIQIGIESGNNKILKQIRKNITIEEALLACEIIKKHDILLHTFFMVGHPQETEETLRDTEVAMKKIKGLVLYNIFTPYPGTESFEFCKKNGLIEDNYDISLHNHQSPANCFCLNIKPDRFRAIVSNIEKMVDRKNKLTDIKEKFSFKTVTKIREKGIRWSFKRARKTLLNK